jgi:lipopolysaccharide/colanic/teichoic acid biosynthesis glycosyltransferase
MKRESLRSFFFSLISRRSLEDRRPTSARPVEWLGEHLIQIVDEVRSSDWNREVANVQAQLDHLPHDYSKHSIKPTYSEQHWMHTRESTPATNRDVLLALATKRAMDLAGAIVGLLFLAPAMIVVALTIKLDSPGTVFFRQLRMGLAGRTFWILKFRTMVPDAEDCPIEGGTLTESPGGALFWTKHQSPVTRVGRFLRRSSLDELPQLINVLRGEMSLVGPRPLHIRDCEQMSSLDSDSFKVRLLVPPGMTGLAQISGRRNLSPEDTLKYDRLYVERWSLAHDLAILCGTFWVVLSGRGAF